MSSTGSGLWWAIAAAVLILAEPVDAQCPGAGDCCIANGSPGCDDLPCCVEVCINDPFCCDGQWDSLCASLANSLCFVCGAGCPGTGNCCSANPTPGCDDFFCCNTVCTGNPFCCDTVWDALCAQQANVLCALCIPPPVCPGGGDCCRPNATPACDDAECCLAVCATDPFCCLSLWDNICAATAVDLCSVCAPVCGDPVLDALGTVIAPPEALAGDQLTVIYDVVNTSVCAFSLQLVCFMQPVGGGATIESPECDQVVVIPASGATFFTRCFNLPTQVVPGLYNVTYQITDPGTATVFDGFTSPDLIIVSQGDLTGDGTVGMIDMLILLAQWGPCDLCADCPADLDGDCQVDITDLLILLSSWG